MKTKGWEQTRRGFVRKVDGQISNGAQLFASVRARKIAKSAVEHGESDENGFRLHFGIIEFSQG
jgi:hypothetical protein